MGSNPGPGKEDEHAIGLNSWTGTEGWPVSSLICDRWQRLNLESHLIAVCAASWHWCSKPRGLCAGWPACYRLAWRACQRGSTYRGTSVRVTWHRETKLVYGWAHLPNTVQGSQPFWYLLTRVVPDKFQNSSKTVVCVCVCVLSTTHHPHTQTLREAPWAQ